VWLSGDEKPETIRNCIASWHRNCPNYEIKEWTAQSLDININEYVRQAYALRKWTFATDYFRLWIMYNYGGIYLDSDVEVLKSFDPLLSQKGFIGFEYNSTHLLEAAVIGAQAGLPIFAEWMREYEKINFTFTAADCGTLIPTVPQLMVGVLSKYGLVCDDKRRSVADLEIYPSDYFCNKDYDGEIRTTDNSYSIHHFAASWLSARDKKIHRLASKYRKKFGGFWKVFFILAHPMLSFKLLSDKRKRRAEARRRKMYGGAGFETGVLK
jgi:hypothetical protein